MQDIINILYEHILNFNKNRFKENRYSHLAEEGLKTFLCLPQTKSASLYLMNDETYEFAHNKTEPEEFEEKTNNAFLIMAENGLIGASLRTVEFYYSKDDLSLIDGMYYCSVPLVGSKGVYGLIILGSESNPDKYDQNLLKLANIFSNVLACALESITLSQKYKRSQELLDQQVAFRTMKLVESQKKLADKFEDLRSNLSMSIPHEVRTPINQILGFSDFLSKYYETTEIDDAHEMLNDINSSARRLKELFENYLYYANLSILATNVYDIMNLQQMITPSVESVIYDSVSLKAEQHKRIDDFKLDIEDMPLAISEGYLKKVIDEIIDNSMKYSDIGTPIEINIKRTVDETISNAGVCEISIKDNGRGMTTEQITNMDAYMQFDRKVYEQQGSGLGISIVQRIIDLHNGLFSIKSEKDKYTEVIIKLPVSTKVSED